MSVAGALLVNFSYPPAEHAIPRADIQVARDAARLISRNPTLNGANTVGNFDGSLANSGERIALAMPDPVFTTNNNTVITNYNYILVDEVTYRDGGRWGQWSDAGGAAWS